MSDVLTNEKEKRGLNISSFLSFEESERPSLNISQILSFDGGAGEQPGSGEIQSFINAEADLYSAAALEEIERAEGASGQILSGPRDVVESANLLSKLTALSPTQAFLEARFWSQYQPPEQEKSTLGSRLSAVWNNQQIMLEVSDLYNEWAQTSADAPAKAPKLQHAREMGQGKDILTRRDEIMARIEELEAQVGQNAGGQISSAEFHGTMSDYSTRAKEEGAGFLERSLTGVVSQIPLWINMAEGAGKWGLGLGLLFGGAALALTKDPTKTYQAGMAGLKLGAAIGGTQEMRDIVRGLQFREFMNLEDENGNKMDPGLAWIFADIIGTGESLLELGVVASMGRFFTGTAQKAAAKSAMGRAVAKMAKSPAFNNIVVRSIGRMAAGTAEQSAEEGLQKVWSLLGEYFAKELSNAEEYDYSWWLAPGKPPKEVIEERNRRLGIKPEEEKETTSFEQKSLEEAALEVWNETTNAAVSFWLTQIPGTIKIGISETMQSQRAGATAAETSAPAPGRPERKVEIPEGWEAIPENEEEITNPVDREATDEEKVRQLEELGRENQELVAPILEEIDEELGTESNTSFKEPQNIIEKGHRPSILAEKPWHNIEHIRDSFRFKTVIENLEDIPKALETFGDYDIQVVKTDTEKLFEPKLWGWRFVAFDLKMPNGQIVEYYMPLTELEEAKDENHLLFEKWRNEDAAAILAGTSNVGTWEEYVADYEESAARYDAAWQKALERMGYTDELAALASFNSFSRSLPVTGEKFSMPSSAEIKPGVQAPSGERTSVKPSAGEATQARPSAETATITEKPSVPIIDKETGKVNVDAEKEIVDTYNETGDLVIRAPFEEGSVGEREIAYRDDAEVEEIDASVRSVLAIESEVSVPEVRLDSGSTAPVWQTPEGKIAGTWAKHKRVDFTGIQVADPGWAGGARTLARLFQVYRHSRLEHFHIILLNDNNEIVAHNTISSGLPAASAATEKAGLPHSLFRLEDRMRRTGATQFYLLHNHPSGNSWPSEGDKGLTEVYGKNIKGFQGHIVIDHGKFSFISKDGRIDYELPLGQHIDYGYDPETGRGPQVKGPEDVAKITRDTWGAKNKTVVVTLDAQHRIVSMAPVRAESLNAQQLYQMTRDAGAQSAIIVSDNKSPHIERINKMLKKTLWERPEIAVTQDHVYVAEDWKEGYANYWSAAQGGDVIGLKPRVEERKLYGNTRKDPGFVWEEEQEYGAAPEEGANPEIIAAIRADRETMQFDSDQEFIEYVETMYEENEQPSPSQWTDILLGSSEKRERTLEEIEQEFADSVDTKRQVMSFLNVLGGHYAREVRKLRDNGYSLSQASLTLGRRWDFHILGSARRVARGGELKDRSYKSIRGKLRKNALSYLILLSELEGDIDTIREIDSAMRAGTETASPESRAAYDAAVQRAVESMEEEDRAAALLKKQEIRSMKEPVKTAVRRITGQTTLHRLITEDEALKAAYKKAQAAANTAYSEGRKLGTAIEHRRMKEIEERRSETHKQRVRIAQIRKGLATILKRSEKMAPKYKSEIQNLIGGIDLVWRRQARTIARLEAIRTFLETPVEEGGALEHVELPDDIKQELAILDKKPLSEFTIDGLEDIYTAAKHFAHLHYEEKNIRVEQQQIEANQARADAIAEMRPEKERKTKEVKERTAGRGVIAGGRAIKDLFGVRHNHFDLIVEKIAGAASKTMDVIYRQVKTGILTQTKYRQDVFNQFQADLYELGFKPEDIKKWTDEKRTFGRVTLTRGQKMALYMHAQNEDNLGSILGGGIGFRRDRDPDRVHSITEDELEKILASMDEDEMAVVEAAKRLFEHQGKDLNKVFLLKNGYELKTLENYFPKDVMPISRYTGKDIEAQSFVDQFKSKFTRVGTPKGMLKEREGKSNPVYLNDIFYDVNRSAMNAAAYIGLEIPLTNASKMLYHPEYKQALINRYGKGTWRELDQALRDIAGEHKTYEELGRLSGKVRSNMAVYSLGLNPWVMLKQPWSYFLFAAYVKSGYLVRGAIDETVHPKATKDFHSANSAEWVERVKGGYSRDVAEVMQKNSVMARVLGTKKTLKQRLMDGIQYFDQKTVSAGMRGAVLQALDEFESGKISKGLRDAMGWKHDQKIDTSKMTADEKLDGAYRFAEWAVERTQPMFSPEHMSGLQRGGSTAKMFTMFSSFTNQELNMIRRAIYNAREYGNTGMLVKTLIAVLGNFAGMYLLDSARDATRGKDKKNLLEAIFEKIGGWFFGVREIERSVASKVKKGTYAGQDAEIPMQRMLGEISDTVASGIRAMDPDRNWHARQKDAEKVIGSGIDVLMMAIGAPYMLKRMAEKAKEIIEE